jgi:phosphoesterase RecJ-like protein
MRMDVLTDKEIAGFKAFIDAHERFIVAGHKEPDGDCLMSCLGMAALLKKLGKGTAFFSAGPFKRAELRPWEGEFPGSLPADAPGEWALVVLDCSDLDRLTDEKTTDPTVAPVLAALPRFAVDHHRTATSDENALVNPDAPATTVLVQQLYQALVGPLDAETAGHLFFGLATDTGFFRFLPPGSGTVFRLAADLADAGADPRSISDDVTGSKPFLTRRLLGQMLSRAELHFDGQVVYTWETIGDTQKYGKEGRDSESLYQLFLNVEKVRAVVFIRQESKEKCTAGMRSKGSLNVGGIAAKFGGGGHINAAGMTAPGEIRQVRDLIFAELEKAL